MSNLKEASSCFHSKWIQLIIKDCELEAKEFSRIKLVQGKGRTALWNLCKTIGYQSHGIPGQACLILERYLYTIYVDSTNISDRALQALLIENAQKRCLLIIAACILLAAKVTSSGTLRTSASTIRLRLLIKGVQLNVKELISTEMEIYMKLKFRLPIWNTVDTALFLATVFNISEDKMEKLPLIVDTSEYKKVEIQNEIRKKTFLPREFRINGNIIRSLHIAAGAVVASSRLNGDPDPSAALADLVKLPIIYIQCLCDIIMEQLKEQPQHQPLILKRKNKPL